MRNPFELAASNMANIQSQKATSNVAVIVSPSDHYIRKLRCYNCGNIWQSSMGSPLCPNCTSREFIDIRDPAVQVSDPAPPVTYEQLFRAGCFGQPVSLLPSSQYVNPSESDVAWDQLFGQPLLSMELQPKPRSTPIHVIEQQLGTMLEASSQSLAMGGLHQSTPPHVIVEALAGTGKTFTIIEACYRMCGYKRPNIIGSPEQDAIWSAMTETYQANKILMVAFNRNIKEKMKSEAPPDVTVSTGHGLGRRILGFHRIGTGRYGVDKWNKKSLRIMADMEKTTVNELFREHTTPKLYAIKQLVGLCKVNLAVLPGEYSQARLLLKTLVETHGVTMPEFRTDDDERFIISWVCRIYEASHLPQYCKQIDYDDMVWLPWKLNLDVRPFEVVFVDERQDLNIAQQELVLKSGKRLIMVGDSHQAIYGFNGADIKACSRMEDKLTASPRGCKKFPLTYTRRCSKAIVNFNRSIVPEFNYFPENSEGAIYKEREVSFLKQVSLGDMIVCRTNAPLFKCCLNLLRNSVPFKTTIKSFFEDTIELIKSFDCNSLLDLATHLNQWKERKLASARASNSDYGIIIEDQVVAIKVAIESVDSVSSLYQLLESVFKAGQDSDDYIGVSPNWVFLTSIHQAKGLESKRCWWLQHDLVPHPKAKLLEQEINLRWVAGTRGIHDMILVDSTPKPKESIYDEA